MGSSVVKGSPRGSVRFDPDPWQLLAEIDGSFSSTIAGNTGQETGKMTRMKAASHMNKE